MVSKDMPLVKIIVRYVKCYKHYMDTVSLFLNKMFMNLVSIVNTNDAWIHHNCYESKYSDTYVI